MNGMCAGGADIFMIVLLTVVITSGGWAAGCAAYWAGRLAGENEPRKMPDENES